MSSPVWPRRAEFVNMVIAMGVVRGGVVLGDVEYDGIAGKQFDIAVANVEAGREANYHIGTALKLGVPVEGLEADGVFRDKWSEVVTLCKEARE